MTRRRPGTATLERLGWEAGAPWDGVAMWTNPSTPDYQIRDDGFVMFLYKAGSCIGAGGVPEMLRLWRAEIRRS